MSYETEHGGYDAPTVEQPAGPSLLDQVLANTPAQSMGAEALQATIRAEIDIQISTAKAYPRNLKAFRDNALTLATLDEKIAGDCYYRLPRGGKTLEGPSIRLAEIVSYAWGNLRTVARIVAIDRETLTAQASCHDLETNTATTKEVRRRITNKSGGRFNDDMITVTANAAMSIAVRNAIFAVVPFAHVKPIFDAAKLVSLGKGKSFAQQRDSALKHWRGQRITDERLCAALCIASIDDLSVDDLITLRGYFTAIKEGEATLADCFPEIDKPKSTADSLEKRLAEKAKAEREKKEPEKQQAEAEKKEPEKKEPAKPTPAEESDAAAAAAAAGEQAAGKGKKKTGEMFDDQAVAGPGSQRM